MGFHLNATKYLKNYTNNSLSAPTDTVGENSGGAPPNWVLTSRVDYTLDGLMTSLTARAMSSGTNSNSFIVCSTACPISTANNRTINDNHMAGYLYFDASVSYRVHVGSGEIETFLNIKNLMNTDPAKVSLTADDFGYIVHQTNTNKYDFLGRVFRAGVRFKM